MATGGERTSSSQRPTRKTIAIATFIVVAALIGLATWVATRPASAPAAPVASGTPTSVAARPVRHRTIVLAPVYTASTSIEQGTFRFHLHKVGRNGLTGTLDYFSQAGPNGFSATMNIKTTEKITGTLDGRHIVLSGDRSPFHFDGTLSADQLTGTFAITDVGTTRGIYTFCPTADPRKATC